VIVYPNGRNVRPYNEIARLCFSDFFPMFNVPFRYGGPWDHAADAKPEAVVVLDEATNQKLFGGANSIGKSLRIQDRDFRVVGVLAHWRPSTKYYDFTQDWISAPEAIYIPFNLMRGMQLRPAGNVDGWKSNGTTWEDFLASETTYIQFWVELPNAQAVGAYRDFVDSYVREQKKLGRFQRPLNNRVTPLTALMKEWKIVSPEMNAMAIVSLLFLIVCALNLTGLLLGKFLARLPEVSVRRALGATKLDVFAQHVVECELVGLAGGAIGLLLSFGVIAFVNRLLPFGAVIRMDGQMLLAALFLSLFAGLTAGIYPAWRVCSVAPAMQLKAQ
jgi:putative ABC transport system permease protein